MFQNDEVVADIPETDKVIGLCDLGNLKFGYALANGTVGVYENHTRIWKAKSKHGIKAILA